MEKAHLSSFLWCQLGRAVILLLLFGFSFRLWALYGDIDHEAKAADPQSEILFNALRESGLLTVGADNVIELPSADAVLALQAGDSPSDNQQIEQLQSLIDDLYRKAHGKRVQQQVEVWNQTREMAAVRDNAQQVNSAAIWQLKGAQGQPLSVPTSSTVPLEFGFINDGKLPQYFGQWLSVGSQNNIIFSKDFDLPYAQNVRVDIIGKPDVSALGKYKVKSKQRVNKLQKDCHIKGALSYVLTLTLPAGKSNVSIPVVPTINPITELDGVALHFSDNTKAEPKCRKFAALGNVVWDTSRMYSGSAQSLLAVANNAKFTVQTADGVQLTTYNPELSATEATQTMGLLSLIGQDKHDLYSLSGMSRKLKEDTDVILTIDSRLQKAALDILLKHYGSEGKRASLVLVDIPSGDILAAAAVPLAKSDVSLWDRNSFSKVYSRIDPYIFSSWQGLNKYNAPGSTFKIITSIALLRAAEKDPRINKAVYGASTNQLAKWGIYTDGRAWNSSFSTAKQPVPPVNNYSRSAMRHIAFKQACGVKYSTSNDWSLIDAIGNSYNTWFAGLAEMADYNAISGSGEGYLVQTAKDFGFDQVFSLQPDELPLKRRVPVKDKNGLFIGRGDTLNAFGGQMDYTLNFKGIAANQFARLSYGQASATTPLTMALAAGSIATGQFMRPRLFLRVNDDFVEQPPFKKIDGVSKKGLDWLRLAMQGVVQNGTAKGVFPSPRKSSDLACRVYAKTGTADTDTKGKSAWMIGYLVNEQKKPKVAFSCMVQNAKKGGAIECGPLVNKLISQYEHITHVK